MSSFTVLAPFDLSIDEFKAEGLRMFGDAQFARMADEIQRNSQRLEDQILVVGWGKAKAAVMIYSVSTWGEESHKLHGFSAIGSGADVAMSQLMLLGQKRSSTLADTLYCVAAAKFASEHSNGLGVGERTSMHVSWKRGETDPKGEVVGEHISEAEVASLREIWSEQGRPRIPFDAVRHATNVSARIKGGTISTREMVANIEASLKP